MAFSTCAHCGDEFTPDDEPEGMVVTCEMSHLPVHKRCEAHPNMPTVEPVEGLSFPGGVKDYDFGGVEK